MLQSPSPLVQALDLVVPPCAQPRKSRVEHLNLVREPVESGQITLQFFLIQRVAFGASLQSPSPLAQALDLAGPPPPRPIKSRFEYLDLIQQPDESRPIKPPFTLIHRVAFLILQAADQIFSATGYAFSYLGGVPLGFKRQLEYRLLFGARRASSISIHYADFHSPSGRDRVVGEYVLARLIPYGVEGGLLAATGLVALAERTYRVATGSLFSGSTLTTGQSVASYIGLIYKQHAAQQSGIRLGEMLWHSMGDPLWRTGVKVANVWKTVWQKDKAENRQEDPSKLSRWNFTLSPVTNQVLFFALVIIEKGCSALLNPVAFAAGVSAGIILGLGKRAIKAHQAKAEERQTQGKEESSLIARYRRSIQTLRVAGTVEREFKLFFDPAVSRIGFLAKKVLDAFGYWISAQLVRAVGWAGKQGIDILFGRLQIIACAPRWAQPVLTFLSPARIATGLLAYPLLAVVAANQGKDTGEFLVKIGADAVAKVVDRYFPVPKEEIRSLPVIA